MSYGWMDWVVPSTRDIQATRDADLSAGPLGGFEYDPGASSGLTVRIDTGEAFPGGAYAASDDTAATYASGSISQDDAQGDPIHDVQLAASTSNQTVYVGHNPGETDGLVIGLDTAFGASWPKTPLYTFDTDGSGVTSQTDDRMTTEPAEQFVSKAGGTLGSDLDVGGNALLDVGVLSGLSGILDLDDSELQKWSLRQAAGNPGDLGAREIWEDSNESGVTGSNMLKYPTPQGMRQIPLEYVTAMVDDFEDGNLAEWQPDPVNFTGDYNIASSQGRDGSNALHIIDSAWPRSMPTYSTPLENYPQPGDMFEFYIKFSTVGSGSSFRFTYGKQTDNTENEYEIQMYLDGTFRLQKDVGGSKTTVASGSQNFSYTGEWWRIRVWWQHPQKTNDHVIESSLMSGATSDATISGDDQEHGAGGIGTFNGDGTEVYIDNITIPDQSSA